MYVIATRTGRTTRRHTNAIQKYARVLPNGKFKFVMSLADATLFRNERDLLQAIGVRAQKVRKITNDLAWVPASAGDVRLDGPVPNGHGRY